jgi:hypothetical protein
MCGINAKTLSGAVTALTYFLSSQEKCGDKPVASSSWGIDYFLRHTKLKEGPNIQSKTTPILNIITVEYSGIAEMAKF